METRTIRIHTEKEYDVRIGGGLLKQCGPQIAEVISPCRVAVISDSNVAPLYLETAVTSLKEAGFEPYSYVFPAGEASKNIHTLSDILEFLGEIPLTRSDCVIALGGGVTGDMAGFAAGVFLRGIRYVQMPTTFLASVDSSVGGKTAVNLSAGKNLAGVFLQPELVLCDTDTFETLSDEIFADGTAEAIKTAVLGGKEIFPLFEEGNLKDHLIDIISFCVGEKGRIVTEDEKESGLRQLLNLGHTIGHAIEKCSHFTITHGHAVAAGMAMITRAADALGWTKEPLSEKITGVLKKNQLPTAVNFTAEELYQGALADKKRRGDQLTLVIPEEIGRCVTRTVKITELEKIIRAGEEEKA
ncbi:MAG: 3-dehydroquinate synthase [Clostridia bacterium]